MLMALIWLVACGLVIPLPMIAMNLFLVAGLIGVASAGPLDFPDLAIWGVVSFVLALFSFFGWRGKVKQQRREEARDAVAAQALASQQQMAAHVAYMRQQLAYHQGQQAPQPQLEQASWRPPLPPPRGGERQ